MMGSIGLLGCGQLGGAMAQALLRTGSVTQSRLWICNRSGPVAALRAYQVNWTREPQELAEHCETLVLALPPAAGRQVRLAASDRAVISVMAGLTLAEISRLTGSSRVIRAMSSPAAENGMAYSPFVAAAGVNARDRGVARMLFSACGLTDEVPDEAQIDVFTAITGPVPGFVAYFAMCMQRYAEGQGVAPEVAGRAVRQLFLSAGQEMAGSSRLPAEFVAQMIDYAGTTAAGFQEMEACAVDKGIARGLEAARLRCRTIGMPEG